MAGRDLSAFEDAGRALFSLGLVKGSEGNLSTFDGTTLSITRTGARLFELSEEDVLEGTLDQPPPDSSSDVEIHRWLYRERDARAVVHAHPPGTMPGNWREGEPHGIYTYGLTLEQALASAVHLARAGDLAPPTEPGASRLVRPVEFEDFRPLEDGGRATPHGAVRILDQTLLPNEERYVALGTTEEVADAIRRMAVRGAPVLGIAAAYALVLAVRGSNAPNRRGILRDLERAGELLIDTRPTAVNIRWAVERILEVLRKGNEDLEAVRRAVLDEARAIERADAQACAAMGRAGRDLLPDPANVLTHCNTGMLCTAGLGTALGVVYSAHLAGKQVHVWVDETRPVLQGARLTTWELDRVGVPHTLIPDGAAASLMALKKVDAILVGADRIAADGSVANKIGTYGLAVSAAYHGVPFYVVAPTSTIDLSTTAGADIRIEERDPSEVTSPMGVRIAPEGTPAANPAFDLTPSDLVTAIVTERGVLRKPYASSLRRVAGARRSA